MPKRQGLDDIIRDAINATKDGAVTTGKRPQRKMIKNFTKMTKDINTDPLSGITRPRRKNMPWKNPDRKTPPRRRSIKEQVNLSKGSAGERVRNQRLKEKYGK